MELIRWSLLQYLIGNSDAHGKNLSFLLEPAGLRLAPAYDLVSVCIYPDIDHELAMAIGDEFDINNVGNSNWANFAQQCDIENRLLLRETTRMIKLLRTHLPLLLAWSGYTDDERIVLERIANFTIRQTERLDKEFQLNLGGMSG
jgi:serine/threonine-protein kinase HipA